MAICPFDHPILSGLLGDDETAVHFSSEAEIRAILAFETELALAEAEEGLVPQDAAAAIGRASAEFVPDLDALRAATAKDGLIVPELIRQFRAFVGGEAARHVHFGATSQDAIDTALMVRLKLVAGILKVRLSDVAAALEGLEAHFGRNRLMGRTRMQAAIPIRVSDRITAWREPLLRDLAHLDDVDASLAVQLGGAAGTLEKLNGKGDAVRARLAEAFGLADAPQWHSQRDRIADYANLLSLMTGSLGKFGADVALLAQAGDEIKLSGGGRSSAMPHKSNPVGAEILVTLARFNAVLLSGMHQSLVHEQERSGAAWTLEWMMLPQMAVAAGASLRTALELIGQIEGLGKAD